ncbi:hypothetical protein HEP_00370000, partial [Hepatocystis sp. ex Piliocolobus tephrosceles]
LAAEEKEKARLAAEEKEKARLAAEEKEKARLAAEEKEKARLAAEEKLKNQHDLETLNHTIVKNVVGSFGTSGHNYGNILYTACTGDNVKNCGGENSSCNDYDGIQICACDNKKGQVLDPENGFKCNNICKVNNGGCDKNKECILSDTFDDGPGGPDAYVFEIYGRVKCNDKSL